jgi:hypothetical protein
MTEQTRAERLADDLGIDYAGDVVAYKAAAELRRLSRVNAELLEALKKAADHAYWPDIEKNIRAAIARAEE